MKASYARIQFLVKELFLELEFSGKRKNGCEWLAGAASHLLGEAVDEAPLAGSDFAEKAAEAEEIKGVLSGGAKRDFVLGLQGDGLGGRRKSAAVVEKVVDRDFQ
jgi:hypothetical protein